MTTLVTTIAIIIAIYVVSTIGTVLAYEIVSEIKGVFNTPMWLENAYEFVVDKLWFWAW